MMSHIGIYTETIQARTLRGILKTGISGVTQEVLEFTQAGEDGMKSVLRLTYLFKKVRGY